MLHAVRSPDPVGVRPVHRHERPVHEVLADPYLRRTESCAAAVCRSIHVECVPELLYGRVGEIAGNNRIGRTRCVMTHRLCESRT